MKAFLMIFAICWTVGTSNAQNNVNLYNGIISLQGVQVGPALGPDYVGGQGKVFDVSNNFFLGDKIGTSISCKSIVGQRMSAIQMYDSLNKNDDFRFGLYDLANGVNRSPCSSYPCPDAYIQQTINDFADNGQLDNPINEILLWCGPKASNYRLARAPFFDYNNDGVYNAYHGDYPVWDANRPWIRPFSMSYSAKNNYLRSNGSDLFEVHTLTAVFSTPNPAVNKAVFTRQEIIYKGADPYVDSVRVGISWDPSVHCHTNDHSGALTSHDAIIAFNSQQSLTSENDINSTNYNCVTNLYVPLTDALPVPYLKFLNRRMDFSLTGNKHSKLAPNGNPTLGRENWVYNTMNGKESNTGIPFPGGHSTILPWPLTLNNIPQRQFGGNVVYDEISLGVTDVGRVYRDQPVVLEYVIGFVDDPGQTGLGNVALVPSYLDDVRDFYLNTLVTDVEEIVMGDGGQKVRVYPNPASLGFYIQQESKGPVEISLFDMMGKAILTHRSSANIAYLDVQDLPRGIYVVKVVFENGGYESHKIVIGG